MSTLKKVQSKEKKKQRKNELGSNRHADKKQLAVVCDGASGCNLFLYHRYIYLSDWFEWRPVLLFLSDWFVYQFD